MSATLGSGLKKKRDEESRLRDAMRDSTRHIGTVVVETDAQVTVTTAETPVLHKTLTVGGSHVVAVRFWGECNVAGAHTLTVRLYVDGVLAKSSRQLCTAAGYWHFDWNPYVAADPGVRTIAIRMLTSASSLTIASGQAQLIIEARGIFGAPRPDKEIDLSLTMMSALSTDNAPVPVLLAGSTAGAKAISESETVPAMPTVADSLLVVYERYQSDDDSYLDIYADNWEAQTFTVGVAHDCDTLMGKVYRTGNAPGTFTFALYNTSSGFPIDQLASQTFDADALTTAAAGQRQYVTIAAQALAADTYAVALFGGVDSSSSQSVRWLNDASTPTYAGGSRVYSANASSSWAKDGTRDYIFEEGDQK